MSLVFNSGVAFGEVVENNVVTDSEKAKNIKVRHPVVITFKKDSTEEQRMKIAKLFMKLQKTIPEFLELEWGIHQNSDGSFDRTKHFYLMTFNNLAGFEIYHTHPIHTQLVNALKDIKLETPGATYQILEMNQQR